jgi:ribosomal protein S1
MDDSNREKLSDLKTGDSVEFYVTDIKNPQRVVLSLLEPNEKLKAIQELKDSSIEALGENAELETYKAEVTKLKTFGIFVKLGNGLSGLIEKEKLVNPIKDYEIGQSVNCSISRVDLSSFKIQLAEV